MQGLCKNESDCSHDSVQPYKFGIVFDVFLFLIYASVRLAGTQLLVLYPTASIHHSCLKSCQIFRNLNEHFGEMIMTCFFFTGGVRTNYPAIARAQNPVLSIKININLKIRRVAYRKVCAFLCHPFSYLPLVQC